MKTRRKKPPIDYAYEVYQMQVAGAWGAVAAFIIFSIACLTGRI